MKCRRDEVGANGDYHQYKDAEAVTDGENKGNGW